MAFRAKVLGREALMRKLERITPGVAEAAAAAKLEVVKEAANLISAAAPHVTGEYMNEIRGERQADNPNIKPVGGQQSKDPDAAAVYAPFIWRFLEFGTAPHVIKAKNAPALAFPSGNGGVTAVKEVMHPGAARKPHVFTTWRAFRKEAKRKVNTAINKAVRASLGK